MSTVTASVETIIEGLQCSHAGCACRNASPGRGHVYCPAHDDRSPSFRVSDGCDGKPLVKCLAGCEQDAVIAALRERDLWPQAKGNDSKLEGNRRRPGRETWFEIRVPDGTLVAYHVRYDFPDGYKEFRWVQSDRKTWGLNGHSVADMPLYGIHDLAIDTVGVIINEGEQKIDALRSLGIPAVGTVTGAGKGKKPPSDNA
jgi:hypothetical protein